MNIGVIGLGLMGGSFGRALVKHGHNVFGLDISEKAMSRAFELNAITEQLTKYNAENLDMLILAVTPDKVEGILKNFIPLLKSGAVVTDFCGIKRKIIDVMQNFAKQFPNINFIGGHPMAGKEFSGIEYSDTELFNNASMILVNVNASADCLTNVKEFYFSVGFKCVKICTAEEHDRIIAYTSQLCHVVSNAYIKSPQAKFHGGFSAGSYKDMTRVARLDPAMWTTLMLDNADFLSEELEVLIKNLTAYKNAIDLCDAEELLNLLSEGNKRKIDIDFSSNKDKNDEFGS